MVFLQRAGCPSKSDGDDGDVAHDGDGNAADEEGEDSEYMCSSSDADGVSDDDILRLSESDSDSDESEPVKLRYGTDWVHFILKHVPRLRQKYPVPKKQFSQICDDLAGLRMFPPHLHFLRIWKIIRNHWRRKGCGGLMNALDKSIVGDDGELAGGWMTGLFAFGVSTNTRPLEYDNSILRTDVKRAMDKYQKPRGTKERSSGRVKLTLLPFGRMLFIELIPTWGARAATQEFEKTPTPTKEDLQYAKALAKEPDMFLCKVGTNMHATRQKTETGRPYYVTVDMAQGSVDLWRSAIHRGQGVLPSTYTDYKLMRSVRFVTISASFPCVRFAHTTLSPRQIGLRIRFRALGAKNLPFLYKENDALVEQHQVQQRRRDRNRRRRAPWQGYWERHASSQRMIAYTNAHAEAKVMAALICAFCEKPCKTKHGLLMHIKARHMTLESTAKGKRIDGAKGLKGSKKGRSRNDSSKKTGKEKTRASKKKNKRAPKKKETRSAKKSKKRASKKKTKKTGVSKKGTCRTSFVGMCGHCTYMCVCV